MKRLFSVALLSLSLVGCVSHLMPDINRMTMRMQLGQQLAKEPDVPAWYTQRGQITQTLGDRVFDKDFNRVFDSLTVAVASMGMTVDNMERQSGFIAARGLLLSPERTKQLRTDQLTEWCRAKGYDLSLLENRGGQADMIDPEMYSGMQQRGGTITISLVKQSDKQTKVKLRFNGIYYPPMLEESYKAIWPALDKQIFMDKGTD